MTEKPRLFGADYSVYVRIARLSLVEKGVEYELVPIDIFADEGPPRSYLMRHPFGRIPAFEHQAFPCTKRVQSRDTSMKYSTDQNFSRQAQEDALVAIN